MKKKSNKDVPLGMRVTPEQHTELTKRANELGIDLSKYCRRLLFKPIKVIVGIKELTQQLKAIGRNLNQLARVLNTQKASGITCELNETGLTVLNETNMLIKKLLKILDK